MCMLMGGHIIEVNISLEEIWGQRVEGAYFRESTVHQRGEPARTLLVCKLLQ